MSFKCCEKIQGHYFEDVLMRYYSVSLIVGSDTSNVDDTI